MGFQEITPALPATVYPSARKASQQDPVNSTPLIVGHRGDQRWSPLPRQLGQTFRRITLALVGYYLPTDPELLPLLPSEVPGQNLL